MSTARPIKCTANLMLSKLVLMFENAYYDK